MRMNSENAKAKPVGIRVLNSICAVVLLGSIMFLLIAGFELVAAGALALALVGLATPVVMGSGGVVEVLLGILEAIAEGVLAIFEGIANAFAALFG